jgi:hypothetical protein
MSPATLSTHDLPNGSIDYRASTHDALSQTKRSTAVREGDVVVVSGVSEIRTRGHGIRMLVVAHIRHSLLPMAV